MDQVQKHSNSGGVRAEPLFFNRGPKSGLVAVVEVGPAKGVVYAYATFEMGPANPIDLVDGKPKWPVSAAKPSDQAKQDGEVRLGARVMTTSRPAAPGPANDSHFFEIVTLGQKVGDELSSAMKFGLANDNRVGEKAIVTPWASNGKLNYFGMYARPNTPYDFRIRLDLDQKRMTVWVCGRGDDDRFLMAEDAPLTRDVTAIDSLQVEQHPNGPAIRNLLVKDSPWEEGEEIRRHLLAKEDRVVGPDRGFKFQSMRSVWGQPGRHVTVAREEGVHMGFPDVARADANHLVSVWLDASHTGGRGGAYIAHSYDSGRTWSEPADSPGGGRISRLKDGTLVLEGRDGFYKSDDGEKTWTKMFSLDSAKTGENKAEIPSHVRELPDGSWMVIGAHYPGGKPYVGTEGEILEFYRSEDRGETWKVISYLQPYPPHSISEASVLVLPDASLLLYARENRNDGFPGVKAYSSDGGKTWRVEDLPFAMVGRTCAGFLNDGRVMLTFRAQIGRSALWAWIGDAHDTTEFKALGAHYNDKHSVGLKDGALHIDNDGIRGQYTTYFMRQPDTKESTIDVTVEVKVVRNDGRAATLSVPYVGKIRLFPDYLELAHAPSVKAATIPGQFNTCRVVREGGTAAIFVNGNLVLETEEVGATTRTEGWTPAKPSAYGLAFGNEVENVAPNDLTIVYPQDVTAKVTGYSIWRCAEVILDDPVTGRRIVSSWSADRDGFPDQYQLDNIIEVEASVAGLEQGYSGWVQLDDGRIFVVNYTDDTAAASRPNPYHLGVPWIRGTFLSPSELPAPR